MRDVPPWYAIGTIAFATALAAAFAALWHGLWPGGAPNLFAFTALCLLAAFFGVQDTFRAMTERPMDPGTALIELLVGGGALFAMTQRALPFFVGVAFVALLRAEVGALTACLVDFYDAPGEERGVRLWRRAVGLLLWGSLVMVLCGLGSGLETSPSLWHWGFGPIAVVGAAAGLVLVSGTQQELVRVRFHAGGAARVDPSLGVGWWGPVAGLVAAVVVLGALLPPLPSVITLHQVGGAVLNVAQHTTHASGPQNVPAPTAPKAHKPGVKPGPVGRGELGLFLFLGLVVTFLIVELVRGLRLMRRLGIGARELAVEYWRRGLALAEQAAAFFVGIARLVQEGLRSGDWRGLQRLLLRWWRLFLDAFAYLWRSNAWRTLVIRSAAHRPGAEFAAEAGPRTLAGAAWRLPPGDPRRRIREIYREFLQRAQEVGLGRRPSQTPAAFARMVAAAAPAAQGGLEGLTASYEWARFSQHEVTPAHVERAESGWRTVWGALQVHQGARARTGSDAGAAPAGRPVDVRPGPGRRGRR